LNVIPADARISIILSQTGYGEIPASAGMTRIFIVSLFIFQKQILYNSVTNIKFEKY
jgi:hypothetical protein